MSFLTKKNNAKTVLSSSFTASETILQVSDASKFPTSGDFLITIWDKLSYPDPSDDINMEIVKVTTVLGNTFIVTRAQEETIAVGHNSGNAVEMLLTAGHFTEIESMDLDDVADNGATTDQVLIVGGLTTLTGDITIGDFTEGSVLYIGANGVITENPTGLYYDPADGGTLAVGSDRIMRNIFQAVKTEAITDVTNVKALMAVRNYNTTNDTWVGLAMQTEDIAANVYSGTRIMTQFKSHAEDAISADMVFDTRNVGTRSEKMRLQADGCLFFTGLGLPYGEIYAYDTDATITISGTGIANKVQVTSFTTNGQSNNTTPDYTNDHITIVKAGKYKVNISITAESAGGTSYLIGFGLFKNNGATQFTNIHVHRSLSGGGGDCGSLNMTGIINVSVNDTIEVWCWNETNTNNVIIDDINLNIMQIGG